jgi:hypothetical protein
MNSEMKRINKVTMFHAIAVLARSDNGFRNEKNKQGHQVPGNPVLVLFRLE